MVIYNFDGLRKNKQRQTNRQKDQRYLFHGQDNIGYIKALTEEALQGLKVRIILFISVNGTLKTNL